MKTMILEVKIKITLIDKIMSKNKSKSTDFQNHIEYYNLIWKLNHDHLCLYAHVK